MRHLYLEGIDDSRVVRDADSKKVLNIYVIPCLLSSQAFSFYCRQFKSESGKCYCLSNFV